MKRFFAVLLALTLLISCAAAQETEDEGAIASYAMPEGSQVFYLPLGEKPEEIPAGLEEMYDLMLDATLMGDVYLIQMPGGHALASVSCLPAKRSFTPDELRALWPQIAQDLSFDVLSIDSAEECAKVETISGLDMLHIETSMTAGNPESPLALKAECLAFWRDGSITEVWFAHPDPASFPGDAAVLEKDLQLLSAFRQSLAFPGSTTVLVPGTEYADPLGRFTVVVPEGCEVIDSASPAEKIQSVRERFVSANPEGADRVFEELLHFVTDMDSVLIFDSDMQGVAEISGERAAQLTGATAAQLASAAGSLQESMAKTYELAVCMEPDQRIWLSGQEHALMGYWLRMGELDLMLDLMICVIQDWLYEVDVYSFEGNQEVRSLMHSFISQTLAYTPPVNGLE